MWHVPSVVSTPRPPRVSSPSPLIWVIGGVRRSRVGCALRALHASRPRPPSSGWSGGVRRSRVGRALRALHASRPRPPSSGWSGRLDNHVWGVHSAPSTRLSSPSPLIWVIGGLSSVLSGLEPPASAVFTASPSPPAATFTFTSYPTHNVITQRPLHATQIAQSKWQHSAIQNRQKSQNSCTGMCYIFTFS